MAKKKNEATDFLAAIEELDGAIVEICRNKQLWNDNKLCLDVFRAFHSALYAKIHNELAINKTDEKEGQIRELLAKYVLGYKDKKTKRTYLGMLTILKNKIEQLSKRRGVDPEISYEYSVLYDDFYALAAFRSMEHFATYMEWDLPENKRIFNMTLNCFGGYWYYATQAVLNFTWQKIFSQAPTGFGKCILASTKVRTPSGIARLGDLKIGDKVFSMRDNKLVESVIKDKWETRKAQYKIRTRGGVEVVISPEHRLLTQRGYVEARDLTADDYLYRLCAEVDGDKPIDDFELMFATLMMFDGACKQNISFTHKDGELFNKFTEALRDNGFTYTERKKKANCREIGVHSNNGKTKEILQRYGLYGKIGKEKTLPTQFFTMPLKQKYDFLGYMFATDGYFQISTSSAGVTLASEQLVRDIQDLCNSCGIYSAIDKRKMKVEGKTHDAWRLTIPAYYLNKIYKNCYCYDKQPMLEEIMQAISGFKGGAYCICTNYPKEVLAGCREFRRKVNKQWSRNKSFKQDIVEGFNGETHLLDDVVYKDFVWERIKSIEYDPTIVDMVDIEVAETHNFLANDLVSHNSYKDTVTMAFIFGYDTGADILKVTGNPANLASNSNRLIKYMLMPRYAKVFPHFQQFGCDKNKMFDVCQVGGNDKPTRLLLHGSDKGESLLFCNKQTPIDGNRYKYKFYDDVTKSKDKAKMHLHEQDIDMYESEWERRKYNDYENLEFFSGTAYHNEDFLCTIKRRNGADNAVKSSVNKYTHINEKFKAVFVKVPKLDYETDKITFPQMYSEEAAKRKRDENPREFYAMDQQEPMPIIGCPFDYKNLMTYSAIPHEGNGELESVYAVLDPARTGANYVTMAIFVKIKNLFYLKDVVFEMRPMEELHNEIVEKIIKHGITQFHIERNTDTSLRTLIEDKCKDRGYFSCTFSEIYTTKVKKDKIADNEATIRNNMVFPEFALYGLGHQMRNFMKYFTGYSYLERNKYDDAPDAVAMFAEKFVRNTYGNTEAYCLEL